MEAPPARGAFHAEPGADADDALAVLGPAFGAMSKEDFKTSLIHAFHCRAPSCPVPHWPRRELLS